MPVRPENLPALTALRFFAAGAIVAFHAGAQFGLFRAGILANGVSFFFVLSGFILAYNYRDLPEGTGRYFVSRFARIWPLHLVTFLLAWLALTLAGGFLPAVANLLLLHAWFVRPDYVFSYNAVSWSISVEAFFYLLLPLLLVARRLGSIVAGVATASFVAAWLVGQAGLFDAQTQRHFSLQFPPMRLGEFAFGVLVARWFVEGRAKHRLLSGTMAEVGALLFVLVWLLLLREAAISLRENGNIALSAWLGLCAGFPIFGLLICIFANGSGALSRLLSSRPLVLLGEISFATYMWHQLVLRFILERGYVQEFGVLAVLAFGLAAIYGGSYLLWRLVEVPARRAILATYDSSRPRADVAGA